MFGRTLARCVCSAGGLGGYLLFSHSARVHAAPPPPPEDENTRFARDLAASLSGSSSSAPVQRPPSGAGSGFHVHVVAPEGMRTAFQLFFPNLLVYLAWQARSPRIQDVMHAWFMTAGGSRSGTLSLANTARSLLSSYSHSSILHLGANMVGLFSFAPRCMDGREAPRTPKLSRGEFLAMYTAAGVLGGLGSGMFSARLGTGRPGLGASGSIFAVLSYAVLCYPDSRVLLFFVFEMSAETALTAATALNLYLSGKEYLAARGRGAWRAAARPFPPLLRALFLTHAPPPPMLAQLALPLWMVWRT